MDVTSSKQKTLETETLDFQATGSFKAYRTGTFAVVTVAYLVANLPSGKPWRNQLVFS